MKKIALCLLLALPLSAYAKTQKTKEAGAFPALEKELAELNRRAVETEAYLSESAKKYEALSDSRTNFMSTQKLIQPKVQAESYVTINRVNTALQLLAQYQKQREEAEASLARIKAALAEAKPVLDELEMHIHALKLKDAETVKK